MTSCLGSLNLTCQIDLDQDSGLIVSGNIFNDTNGLLGTLVNAVDGAITNASGLFANLIDFNNKSLITFVYLLIKTR